MTTYMTEIFSSQRTNTASRSMRGFIEPNERVLGTLPGDSRTYLSADTVKCNDAEERQNYPVEFLNSLIKGKINGIGQGEGTSKARGARYQ